MRSSDRDTRIQGAVIPFQPRKEAEAEVQASTIAALVAVTILHDADERPEDKLIDLIEQSGDAEVVDAVDATDGLAEARADLSLTGTALNDNNQLC